MRFKQVLTNRNFSFFFIADLVSGFGSGMAFIGINWVIYELTGSSGSVGLLMCVTMLSSILCSPLAGTLTDRVSRKHILVLSNGIRGAVITVILIVMLTEINTLPLIYLLAVLNGAGNAFYIPASKAYIQEISSGDQILQSNSLTEISLQFSMFLSVGISGFIYKYIGFEGILVIDAATFFASMLFLLNIHYSSAQETKHHSYVHEFLDGIHYLWSRKTIFFLGILAFVPYVVTITSNVVLPDYVTTILSGDEISFGIADMCYGIGAFLAGVIISNVMGNSPNRRQIGLMFLVSISTLLFLYWNTSVYGLFGAFISFGIANTSLKILFNTVLMAIVPEGQLGRAMSTWVALSSGMQIIFTYSLGMALTGLSANTGYLILAGIMAIGLAFILTVYRSHSWSTVHTEGIIEL